MTSCSVSAQVRAKKADSGRIYSEGGSFSVVSNWHEKALALLFFVPDLYDRDKLKQVKKKRDHQACLELSCSAV